MLKVVIDTNIWISALIAIGNPKKIIDAWIVDGLFTVVYPFWLIDEIRKTWSKPRLAGRIRVDDLEQLIGFVEEGGFLIDAPYVPAVSRDPKDDPFLACVQGADCDYLVTGDLDLSTLKTYGRTHIVTPAEFVITLRQL